MAKQSDGDIFPAEELLEKRIRKDGELEYLVKWKGWTKRFVLNFKGYKRFF